MIEAKGTLTAVTKVAVLRDADARVPTPGYRPGLGYHVCPACTHAGKVERVDPPDYRCKACAWERGGKAYAGVVGTLDDVREVAKDVFVTLATEAVVAMITTAKAKTADKQTADEKVLATVEIVDEKPPAEEPKPIDDGKEIEK
jgi:hypothetical protein